MNQALYANTHSAAAAAAELGRTVRDFKPFCFAAGAAGAAVAVGVRMAVQRAPLQPISYNINGGDNRACPTFAASASSNAASSAPLPVPGLGLSQFKRPPTEGVSRVGREDERRRAGSMILDSQRCAIKSHNALGELVLKENLERHLIGAAQEQPSPTTGPHPSPSSTMNIENYLPDDYSQCVLPVSDRQPVPGFPSIGSSTVRLIEESLPLRRASRSAVRAGRDVILRKNC
jgi:hypothetical protein